MSERQVTIEINAFKLDPDRHIWERRTERTWIANQRRILSNPYYEGTLVKQIHKNPTERQLITTSLVQSAARITSLLNVNSYSASQLSAQLSVDRRHEVATNELIRCVVTTNAMLTSSIQCRVFHIASLFSTNPLMLNWIANAAARSNAQGDDFKINVYVAIDEQASVSATSMQVASIIESLARIDIVSRIKLNGNEALGELHERHFDCGRNAQRISQVLTNRDFQLSISNDARKQGEQLSLPLTTDDERANLFADVTQAARDLQSSIETKHPKYSIGSVAKEDSDGTLELKIVFKLR
jgi:hypothetical protein